MDFAEVINRLAPEPDGVETDFTVPSRFQLGSFRAIVNGIVYDPSDEQWGFAELNPTTVRFLHAPKAGFHLQGYYREPYAEGSPFGPDPIP